MLQSLIFFELNNWIAFSYLQPYVYAYAYLYGGLISENTLNPLINKIRADGKCGADFPWIDGSESECDPNSENLYCCSSQNWCGNSQKHCNCNGCFNYKDLYQNSGTLKPHSSNTLRVRYIFALTDRVNIMNPKYYITLK